MSVSAELDRIYQDNSRQVLNARDLNEAIQLASNIPPARLGSVELRPIRELPPKQ